MFSYAVFVDAIELKTLKPDSKPFFDIVATREANDMASIFSGLPVFSMARASVSCSWWSWGYNRQNLHGGLPSCFVSLLSEGLCTDATAFILVSTILLLGMITSTRGPEAPPRSQRLVVYHRGCHTVNHSENPISDPAANPSSSQAFALMSSHAR